MTKRPGSRFWMGVLVTLLLPQHVSAQTSDCAELLRHGIYEHFVQTGRTSSFSETHKEICRAYSEYQSDAKGAGVKASYGLFSGSASYSANQIRSVGDAMCDKGTSITDDATFRNTNSSTISQEAVNAWKSCVAHRDQQIVTAVTFQDTDQGTEGLTVSLRYAAAGVSNNRVERIDATGNLACTGGVLSTLVNKGNLAGDERPPLDSVVRAVTCKRTISSKPFLSGTREVYADAASLELHTTAGTLVYQLPPVVPKTSVGLPIGSIVAWFSKQGPVPDGWAVCDGTNGTPDLRNTFVMGTGDVSGVGSKGGSNEVTATNGARALLATGKTDHPYALRVDGGNGVVNHQTQCAGCNLVNSFVEPGAVTMTFDNRPSYVGLLYIMKTR